MKLRTRAASVRGESVCESSTEAMSVAEASFWTCLAGSVFHTNVDKRRKILMKKNPNLMKVLEIVLETLGRQMKSHFFSCETFA